MCAVPEDLRTIRVKEAAEILGKSEWETRRLVRLNLIPHIRLGRSIRFRVAALRRWMEEQEARGGGEAEAK